MLLYEEHERSAAEPFPLKEDVLLLRELPRGGLGQNSIKKVLVQIIA